MSSASRDLLLTGRVAERHLRGVRDIPSAGHEIALHGYPHRSPATLDRTEEERELVAALAARPPRRAFFLSRRSNQRVRRSPTESDDKLVRINLDKLRDEPPRNG